MLQLIEDHGALLVESTPGDRALRYSHPVYVAYRTQIVALLAELIGEQRPPTSLDRLAQLVSWVLSRSLRRRGPPGAYRS
jgi:hypothetical protein